MSERAVELPFTREDATVWAHATTRIGARWRHFVTEPLLHLSMESNWTDALNMWIFAKERSYIERFAEASRARAMRILNDSRAFGLTEARRRYSRYLYRMLNP